MQKPSPKQDGPLEWRMKIIPLILLLALVAGWLVGCSSESNLSIQERIDKAKDGDTIVIAPGTHRENLVIKGKSITLKSENPSDSKTVAKTVIDGGGAGSVITISGRGENATGTEKPRKKSSGVGSLITGKIAKFLSGSAAIASEEPAYTRQTSL